MCVKTSTLCMSLVACALLAKSYRWMSKEDKKRFIGWASSIEAKDPWLLEEAERMNLCECGVNG